MEKYIALSDIPKRFGGSLECEFDDPPALDEEAAKVAGDLTIKWVHGPIRYMSHRASDRILAVGKNGVSTRRLLLATLYHDKECLK
jgi:hypothetical protein